MEINEEREDERHGRSGRLRMNIIHRSALEHWGRNPPPELAYILSDNRRDRRIVTWPEVMKNRRELQRERLIKIRQETPWRACKLWVGYFDQWLMGGWQAFLEDFRGDGYREWIDRDRRFLKPRIMEIFPLILPLGSEHEQWEQWKAEFAKQFERRRQDRLPLGVAYLWKKSHELRSVASMSEHVNASRET